jgi:hypothetical protein
MRGIIAAMLDCGLVLALGVEIEVGSKDAPSTYGALMVVTLAGSVYLYARQISDKCALI